MLLHIVRVLLLTTSLTVVRAHERNIETITIPAQATIAARQTSNALSQLISGAIQIGNSVLSDIITSSPITTTSSPSPTSTAIPAVSSSSSSSLPTVISSSTNYLASTTSSPTTASPSTTSSAALTTPSHGHSNKTLIIALAVVLGLLVLSLLLGGLWFCRRRSKRKQAALSEEESKSWSSSDDARRSWHDTGDTLPRPTLPMLETSYARQSYYDPTSAPLATTETRDSLLSPISPEMMSLQIPSAQPSQRSNISSDQSETLVSPVSPLSPVEMPVELDGGGATWPVKGTKRSRITNAIWPSRTDSSKFDFGFGKDAPAVSQGQSSFRVPRRPVGGTR